MPVQQESSKVILNGDGTQLNFSFNFKIFKAENIKVYTVSSEGIETEKTLGIDYTFSSEDVELGGTVTFGTAPLATEKVLIIRNIPLEQNANFRPVSGFPEEVITDSFDTSRMIDQDLQEQLDRCVKVDASSTTNPQLLANKVERIYTSIDNIDIVVDNITDVNNVSDNMADINTVNDNISSVNAVSSNIGAVNTINININDVTNVSDNINDINTVSGNINDVTAVAQHIADVIAVADNESNINIVANDLDGVNDIGTVAMAIDDVGTTGQNIGDIMSVAANETNINTVATNIADVNTCAGNIDDIQGASENAALAKQYAIGVPTEPAEGSAKYWAGQAAGGQVQSDMAEADVTKKSYIQNKLLGNLSDVTITTPTNGQALKYNSTSQKWENDEVGGASSFADLTGQPTDNANLATALNGKVNTSDLVEVNPMITSYVNGKTGYNIWANGYCEHWGNVTCTSSETDKTISFLKTFANTNYNVSISGNSTYSSSSNVIVTCLNMWSSKSTGSMVIKTYRSNYMNSYDWKVSGYLAEGQY